MTDVHVLAAADMRARRRIGVVLFVFACEAIFGLLVALPLHGWAAQSWGAHPEGDGVLFRAGGYELLTWLTEPGATLPVMLRTTMTLLVVGTVLLQLPLGALLHSLQTSRIRDGMTRSPSIAQAMSGAPPSFLPLMGIFVGSTLITGLVLGTGALAAGAVGDAFTDNLGDARAFTVKVVVMALFGLIAIATGVVADFARTAVVRDQLLSEERRSALSFLFRGFVFGVRTARKGLFKAMVAWGGRAAAGLLLLWFGAVASSALGGRALLVLVVIHQAIALARVALRASWLAWACRAVASTQTP